MRSRRNSASGLKRKTRTPASVIEIQRSSASAMMPAVPFEEVLSFLKETRGILSWTSSDMTDSLKISKSAAKQIIVILELQGYVKRTIEAGDTEWLTTLNGETISGSVAPRFSLKHVKEGLAALAQRIGTINRDRRAAFRVAGAVAFGDFLSARKRVQAADVGVRLESLTHRRKKESPADDQRQFLKQLRAGSATIRVQTYKPWMSRRSHLRLV